MHSPEKIERKIKKHKSRHRIAMAIFITSLLFTLQGIFMLVLSIKFSVGTYVDGYVIGALTMLCGILLLVAILWLQDRNKKLKKWEDRLNQLSTSEGKTTE